MAGFPLTGVDPQDPTPGIRREILFQQGASTSAGTSRDVVLVAQKLGADVVENSVTLAAAGTETADVLGTPLLDEEDVIARFGRGSEMHLLYRCYTDVDQSANIYGIAPAVSGTRATVVFTVGGSATATGTTKISLLGETVEAGIVSGDNVTVQAASIVSKINGQTHWPVTAWNTAGAITVTSKFSGGRGDYFLTRMRMIGSATGIPTPSKAAVTTGGAVDDITAVTVALETRTFYYHVLAQTLALAATATDNGVGEYASYVTQQSSPSGGIELCCIFGLTGTNSNATTVGASVNNVRAFPVWAENNEWSAGMIAAHFAAVMRSKQIALASANLTDYGTNSGDIFKIPAPFLTTDRPTATEIRLALNNGVSPIGFGPFGAPFIIRQITSRCLIGSVYDYRAREGHIPSATDFAWQTLRALYASQKQPFVAADLVDGERPTPKTTRPADVVTMAQLVTELLCDNPGGPILDPGSRDFMKNSAECVDLPDGTSCRWKPIAARHNNKGQFLLEESSQPY